MADNYTALKSSQKKRYISKETFNSLDLSTIPVGSEYEVVSPIEKGDLSADINNALNKAENALPKPTNDTTGSAGQVLKKTANGSEWGDAPSGGGKYYIHDVFISNDNISAKAKLPFLKFKYISKDNTEFSPTTNFNYEKCFDVIVSDAAIIPPTYYKVATMNINTADNTKLEIMYYPEYPYSITTQKIYNYSIADMMIKDTVFEL